MKALTLHQPWASLVALRVKTIETRSWSTNYRGPLAIHAGKRRFSLSSPIADYIRDEIPRDTYDLLSERLVSHVHGGEQHFHHADCEMCDNYPLGQIVATCELSDVVATYPHMAVEWPDQIHYGDFSPGRFAWILRRIEPCSIPATGHQGLWNWERP